MPNVFQYRLMPFELRHLQKTGYSLFVGQSKSRVSRVPVRFCHDKNSSKCSRIFNCFIAFYYCFFVLSDSICRANTEFKISDDKEVVTTILTLEKLKKTHFCYFFSFD